MGDVAQILGLGDAAFRQALLGGSAGAPKGKGGDGKKPEGVNREVFSLLGSSSALPSVVPSGGRIREMLLRKEVPATRWLWNEFDNSARADGVRLKHWQRAANVSLDYAFSRFNRKTAVVHYSGDEYAQAVAPQDGAGAAHGTAAVPAASAQPVLPQSPAWSKEETDVLFSMCDEFNLRWYVIEDRWPLSPRRSLAELKDRYYGVARAVLLSRRTKKSKQLGRQLSTAVTLADGSGLPDEALSGEDAAPGGGPALTALLNSNSSSSSSSSSSDSAFSVAFLGQRLPTSTAKVTAKAAGLCENAIVDFAFDRAHEERRVQQLGALFSRSLAEEKEETNLVNEVRRIDALLRRLQKDAPKPRKSTLSAKGGAEGAEGGITSGVSASGGSGVSAAAAGSTAAGSAAAAPIPGAAAAAAATPGASAAASAAGSAAAAAAAQAAHAMQSDITLTQFPPTLLEKLLSEEGYRGQHASLEPELGVHLRSSRFHVLPSQIGIGSRLHLKMDSLLTEIGVPLRPVPTINVCSAYDRLRQDTLKLLALQAKLFDVKGELAALQGLPQPLRPGQTKATLRLKKASLTGLPAAGAASAALAAGGHRKAAKKATGQGSPGKRVKVKLEGGDEALDSGDDGWSEAGLEDTGGVKRKALPGVGAGIKHKRKKLTY
jgi:hypothetical protein